MNKPAQFTPGTWVVEGSDITNGYPDQGSRILIAEKVAIESDAHLIAAAPAMYSILLSIKQAIDDRKIERSKLGEFRCKAIEDALAQAEGRHHE